MSHDVRQGSTGQRSTFAGGVVTSALIGLVVYAVITEATVASHAWGWWAAFALALALLGLVLEVRSGEGSRLFGLGVAVGAVIAFGGLFLIMSALGLDIGH